MGRPGPGWNGFAPEGTLSRRLGVWLALEYMLCVRECAEVGDAKSPIHRGELCAVENVADVGVLKSPGDGGRYE